MHEFDAYDLNLISQALCSYRWELSMNTPKSDRLKEVNRLLDKIDKLLYDDNMSIDVIR